MNNKLVYTNTFDTKNSILLLTNSGVHSILNAHELQGKSMHDRNKHQITVKIHHCLWRKLEKEAARLGMNPTQFIRMVLFGRVMNVELDAEDAQIVADRIKMAYDKGKMV